MAAVANIPHGTVLSPDSKWVRCTACDKAYWGAFRPTDFIAAKFSAHATKAHKAQAPVEAEGADAPSDHADFVPAVAAVVAARQAANANGACKLVRAAGPHTPLGDPLADIAAELDPRLGLAQGPRMFPEEGGDKVRQAARRNRGQK